MISKYCQDIIKVIYKVWQDHHQYEGCIGKTIYSFPNETIANELHDENNENARHKRSLRVTPLNTAAYHTYDQVGESIVYQRISSISNQKLCP